MPSRRRAKAFARRNLRFLHLASRFDRFLLSLFLPHKQRKTHLLERMALPDLIVPPHEQAPAAEVGAAPQLPRRKILSHADMDQWTQSEAYRNIEHFIVRLREASTAESDPSAASPVSCRSGAFFASLCGSPDLPVQVLRRINELLKGFAKELDGAASPMSPGRAFPAWLRKVEQVSKFGVEISAEAGIHDRY